MKNVPEKSRKYEEREEKTKISPVYMANLQKTVQYFVTLYNLVKNRSDYCFFT